MSKHNELIFPLSVAMFFLLFLKGAYFASYGIDFMSVDGSHFANAARIIDGDIIYRDFHSYFPPLHDYFLAFLMKYISGNIVIIRISQLIISMSLYPTFLFLARKLGSSRKESVFIASLPFLAILRPELMFIHAIFYVGFLLLVAFIYTKRRHLLFLSGLTLALGFLFRIEVGMVYIFCCTIMLLVSSCLLWKESYKKLFVNLSTFILPVLAIFGITLIWLGQKEIIVPMIEQSLFIPIKVAKAIRINLLTVENLFPQNISYKNLNKTFEGWVYVGFIFIFTFTILEFIKSFKKKIGKKEIVGMGLLLIIFIFLPYIFGRMDMGHLLKGGMGFILLGGYLFTKTEHQVVKTLVRIYVFVSVMGFVVTSVWWIYFFNSFYNFGSKGGLYINSKYVANSTKISGNTIQQANQFLSESENKYVFALPYMPVLYYLSDKKSPVVYDSLLVKSIVEPYNLEYIIRELETKEVDRIVYDRYKVPSGIANSMKDYAPALDEYILTHFRTIVETEDGWLLMSRI